MADRKLRTATQGGTTAYWLDAEDGDGYRIAKRDTTAYQTYKPEDDPRLRCDQCARCRIYGCNGITAVHHFIHMDEEQYFIGPDDEFERGLSADSNYFKHPDRDSGL